MAQLLLLFTVLLSCIHPFHVSVCSINHAPQEQTLQITQKVFADDLEEALNAAAKASSQTAVDVLNPSDPEVLESIIRDYLVEHLQITVNGKAVAPNFLGYEREELALWCYLEVEDVADVQQIKVRSSILVEAFDDQTNIVHIKYLDTIKSMKLAKDYLQDQVEF